jgi:hypothetical protein
MNVCALHASKHDVFCGDCAFHEPYGPTHRCRHPSAVQEFKTYVGLAKRFVEPEDKNAHNDCADFKARPLRVMPKKWVVLLGLMLVLLAIAVGLPWVLRFFIG